MPSFAEHMALYDDAGRVGVYYVPLGSLPGGTAAPARAAAPAGAAAPPVGLDRLALLEAERGVSSLPGRAGRLAGAVWEWAGADLGLWGRDRPALCWYAASYAPRLAGFFEPSFRELWLNAGLAWGGEWGELAETVAHELRHAWQWGHWPPERFFDGAARERDAAAYTRQFLSAQRWRLGGIR